MNSKLWIRRMLSMCLMAAVFTAYSMVALAGTGPIAGELTVTGNGINEGSAVTVNGEAAKSGRSIFSSSVIATPSNVGAIINLGKNGIIELAPGTTFKVSFDENSINGDLAAGKVTVVGSASGVNVKTSSGEIVKLSAGDSVTAAGKKDDDDDNNHAGGTSWWVWAVIFGGAAAGVLIAAVNADNRVAIGGTATTVSPVR